MGKKKTFFQKVENQRALLIALFVALIILVADMLKTAAIWSAQTAGVSDRTAIVIGFCVAAIVIFTFIRKFEHLLNE